MSTKPFKKIISTEDEEVSNIDATVIKPFKIDSEKEIDTSITIEPIENSINNDNMQPIVASINFFSTFNGILVALFTFVLIAVIADTVDTVSNILTDGSISSYLYLIGLVLLLAVLFLNILSAIKQFRAIKYVKNIKKKFILQKQNPTAEIIPLTNLILDYYVESTDKKIIESIKYIRDELNTSQIYKEIYKDLDSGLLAIMDNKAKNVIHKASMQAAISTAISPFPLFDMLLILWRSVFLTKEIAMIYGFRPAGLTTLVLLKQAVFNVAFAGVAELASELTNEIASSTVLAKFSQSAGQGIANGILIARLGYGIMEACRPIEISEKRGSFIKTIMPSILKVFKSKDKE